MTWLRDETTVDEMIQDMVNRTKGKYLTQAVAFNKTCPRQMGLLKAALMSSVSFSGLMKEMLAQKFMEDHQPRRSIANLTPKKDENYEIKKRNTNGFI